jgi:hypothetical protein
VELIDKISCDYMQKTINFALCPARLDCLKKVSKNVLIKAFVAGMA